MEQFFFTKALMKWHRTENKREMPWKGEKNPYKIWLSEIILQQTRVEQGWNYYEKFIQQYPTVYDLANAKDEVVFKLWEGLGYYNRCKNLLITARIIVEKFNGNFPTTFEEIIDLKGIGPYTAAAIASFAFNLPYPVVDGNVFRILSRFFAVDTAIDTTEGKKYFAELAMEVLDKKYAGIYNQAIMDFGATVCKPVNPLCSHCVLQKKCLAHQLGLVATLPTKEKVLIKKNRWLYYFMFEHNSKVLINKRVRNDIWQNLFEFYLVETNEQMHCNEATIKLLLKEQLNISNATIPFISALEKQQLTHQTVRGQLIKIELEIIPATLKNFTWVNKKKLKQLPFPKFIHQLIDEK
jgi:A/G-specific adenine glycosylase